MDRAPYKNLQSQFSVLYKEAQEMKTQFEETRNLLQQTKGTHLRQMEQMEVGGKSINQSISLFPQNQNRIKGNVN